jgi:thiamine biosynthesis lipoprotein
VPADTDIAAALQRGGWQRLQLDEAESRALQPGGVALDFSGIAKGFAVDKVSDYLVESGFPHHLMEIGGELKGRGLRPDGHPWWVQLESPLQAQTPEASQKSARPAVETIVALHELAVASSGDYRKFFLQDGRRHAHTLDPRTGRSVDNGLAAVSVLHEQCMLADAQATVLMVLGLEQGLAWATEQGVAALFVAREGEGFAEHLSPAMGDLLE